MLPVVHSDRAAADWSEILAYLDEHSPAAADRISKAAQEKLRLLGQLPEMGRRRDELAPGLRSVVLEKYLIFYRVTPDAVVIVRILYGRRDLEAAFRNGADE